MPRLVHRLPVPRLHKPSGRARLRIDGKEIWLGVFGSLEAKREYDRIIDLFKANGRKLPPNPSPVPNTQIEPIREVPTPKRERIPPRPASRVTITMLIAQFSTWSDRHYRKLDGTHTRANENFRCATKPLRKMFGTLPVESFGPSKLLALRESWIEKGLARKTINGMVRRVRQIFKWGISRELIPFEVYARLQMVETLQPGRGGVESPGTRGSVPLELIEKTIPHLPLLIQAFVVVAYHSGCRVGELASLTTGMLDRSGEVWIADLADHKTAHKGKRRRLYFGPKAQIALQPWLLPDQPEEPIFSPLRVDEKQKKRRGKKRPGRTYFRNSLGQVLRRAIRRAGIEPWTLGQLRHSAAVRITDEFDLETARQLLGYSDASMTRHYSQDANHAAKEAARKIG